MQETIQNCGFISHNSDCITHNCLLYSFYTFLCRAWISSVCLYTSQKHKISGLTLTFNWLPVERTVVLIWEFQGNQSILSSFTACSFGLIKDRRASQKSTTITEHQSHDAEEQRGKVHSCTKIYSQTVKPESSRSAQEHN